MTFGQPCQITYSGNFQLKAIESGRVPYAFGDRPESDGYKLFSMATSLFQWILADFPIVRFADFKYATCVIMVPWHRVFRYRHPNYQFIHWKNQVTNSLAVSVNRPRKGTTTQEGGANRQGNFTRSSNHIADQREDSSLLQIPKSHILSEQADVFRSADAPDISDVSGIASQAGAGPEYGVELSGDVLIVSRMETSWLQFSENFHGAKNFSSVHMAKGHQQVRLERQAYCKRTHQRTHQFEWAAERQQAVNTLKQPLTTARVPYRLRTIRGHHADDLMVFEDGLRPGINAIYVVTQNRGMSYVCMPCHRELPAHDRPDLLFTHLSRFSYDTKTQRFTVMGEHLPGDVLIVEELQRMPGLLLPEDFHIKPEELLNDARRSYWFIAKYRTRTRVLSAPQPFTELGRDYDITKKKPVMANGLMRPLACGIRPGHHRQRVMRLTAALSQGWMVHPVAKEVLPWKDSWHEMLRAEWTLACAIHIDYCHYTIAMAQLLLVN
uniref:Uncharacterized protein n=1 Tax=Caenorhabditis japonica TaxID=281687 RepID=A0A8R1IG10_CAEJA